VEEPLPRHACFWRFLVAEQAPLRTTFTVRWLMGPRHGPKTDEVPSDLPSQSRAYTHPIKDGRSLDSKRLPSCPFEPAK